MILVTGSTGHLGGAVIDFLLGKGVAADGIAALVRNSAKSETLRSKNIHILEGNYDDYASLLSAFEGVDKLLFVSGSEIEKRAIQHENIINAAKETGVKHIVYTSFERKNESSDSPLGIVALGHVQTEEAIKASGLTYTIMRNNYYMDALPSLIGDKVLETGIFFPAGEGKAAFAARIDMAEAAANILSGTGHENMEYRISNVMNYSFADVAAILSELSGKQVSYTSPSVEEYIEVVTKSGMPVQYASILAGFAQAIEQGEFYVEKSDLEMLLGRKPMGLREFLSQ